MKINEVKETLNKIFNITLGYDCPYTINEVLEKIAFDIKLPVEVIDSTTFEKTWATSLNSNKYITNSNMEKKDIKEGWMLPKKDITSIDEIIEIWNKVNLTTTERVYDSINVSESDTIYRCENVYRSSDCTDSKNIIFCDSCHQSEYLLASQRSSICSYSIRVDDSTNCSNSYNVICSNKVSNSLFIQDCSNLYECIFCSHISNKRFCIANMQFEEKEYFEIKKAIINWIITS